MNLYLRLMALLLSVRWKSPVSILEELRSSHLVWPNDLDLMGHMNNGRYLTVTDLARMEMLIRAGLWQAMRQRGIYPVLAGETIQFRKALLPFQRYEIRTRTLGWDEKFLYVEHRFVQGDALAALALVKVRVIGRGRPRPAEVLRTVCADLPDVNMNQVIEEWNASTEEHWTETLSAAA